MNDFVCLMFVYLSTSTVIYKLLRFVLNIICKRTSPKFQDFLYFFDIVKFWGREGLAFIKITKLQFSRNL